MQPDNGVGMLFVAARATPVHAISAGTIGAADDGDPRRVALHGEDGRLYLYGCLAARQMSRSGTVAAGDVIGELDGEGPRLRLPYLEVGVREADGCWCNPYEVLLGLPDADELTISAAEDGLAVDPDDGLSASSAIRAAPLAPAEVTEPPIVEGEAEPEHADAEAVATEPVAEDPAPEPEPEPVEEADDDLLSLVAPPDPPQGPRP